MKILGLDYGEVRTGIAITDELGMLAHGLETVEHGNIDKVLINRIKEIVEKEHISKIVIGYPYNMNATKGPRIEKTEHFIKKLKKELQIEIVKMDERLTTVSAHKTMTELRLKNEKKKKLVDTISAEYILQMYLDKYER